MKGLRYILHAARKDQLLFYIIFAVSYFLMIIEDITLNFGTSDGYSILKMYASSITILPSSSTQAILLTSLAIYSCIPLKAIQYYINITLKETVMNELRH